MFMNERRIDIVLKLSLFIMWIQCAFWIATVSSSHVATNGSAESLSYKTVSLTQTHALAASSSGKIASNITDNRTSSPKPPTTKSSRFLDDYGELPGVQKDDDDDDYNKFINTTVLTTTVRIPTQEKGEINAFLSGARPSVNGYPNKVGETGDAAAAAAVGNTSSVLKKSLQSETESVIRTSASSNLGKNSTTKTDKAQQVAAAAAGINLTKLPATRDAKYSKDHEAPNNKNNDKSFSTATKTAAVKAPIHQRIDANASSAGANPSAEDKHKPTVRNGNGTKSNTVLGASKTKNSLNTSKTLSTTFSTTPNVTGNGTNPLKKTAVASNLKINITSKTNKSSGIASSASNDKRDHTSDAKTFPSRNITMPKNHTATSHSIKDTSLKTGVSNSTSVVANVNRKIAANVQSSQPSVVASIVKSTGNITKTNTKNQTSKALTFKSVLKNGKSNAMQDASKTNASDSDNMKHTKQFAPTSKIADAGKNTTKASNRTSETSNINKTLKADKSIAVSNVTKDKTSIAGNVKSNKIAKVNSNITGTNDTNKAKNNTSAPPTKLKNTLNLDKSNPVSIASKDKESNIGKISKKPASNTTGNDNATKTKNQTQASLTLISALKFGVSNLTTSVAESKGGNAVNMTNIKQPAKTSNVSGTVSSSKAITRTSATKEVEANKSNTPSNVAKEKTVDSPKDNKPSAKPANTTGTGNSRKTNDNNSATESIKATLKTGKLNTTVNKLKDKESAFGNIKKKQSVVNLNVTATGNVPQTNNQSSKILVFKSVLKIEKSKTAPDLTKDKANGIANAKSNNGVKSDKIVSKTSIAKDTDNNNASKTNNQASKTRIIK